MIMTICKYNGYFKFYLCLNGFSFSVFLYTPQYIFTSYTTYISKSMPKFKRMSASSLLIHLQVHLPLYIFITNSHFNRNTRTLKVSKLSVPRVQVHLQMTTKNLSIVLKSPPNINLRGVII